MRLPILKVYPIDETYFVAEDAQLYTSTRTRGVFSADTEFPAYPAGGMSFTIDPGQGWFKINRFAGAAFALPEPVTFMADISDNVLNRVDRIILGFDFIANEGYIELRKGSPASSAVAPALINQDGISVEIGIYDIHVDAGIAEITSANIDPLFLDEDLCGVMRDGVTGIPTAQLNEMANAKIQAIADELGRVNAGTEWMLKTQYAPDATAQIVGNTLQINSVYVNPGTNYSVLFDAPENFNPSRIVQIDGNVVNLTDLSGNTLNNAWIQNAPVTLYRRGNNAFFAGGKGIIRSTDEQVVGIGINGKPIYQKTFANINTPAVAAGSFQNITVPYGVANLIRPKIIAGSATRSDGAVFDFPVGFPTQTGTGGLAISIYDFLATTLEIRTVYSEAMTIELILEYQKSDD